MNRYLLAAVLGAIAFLTLLGIGNGRDLFQSSRNTISSTPSSAAEETALTGIESAGQNVLRQTSPEAIERAAGMTTVQPAVNPGADTTTVPPAASSTPPVSPEPAPAPQPAPAPTTDQEAIPALW